MLLEEIPDRLAYVDEVAGLVMTEILDRTENHIGSRLAIAPFLFADQNILRDIHKGVASEMFMAVAWAVSSSITAEADEPQKAGAQVSQARRYPEKRAWIRSLSSAYRCLWENPSGKFTKLNLLLLS